MIELPPGFPHIAPEGYSYEVEEFKRGYSAIWLRHHYPYIYSGGESVRTIWGFYKAKTDEYYSPVNSKTVGQKVRIEDTRNYTSMPIHLNPLEAAFL